MMSTTVTKFVQAAKAHLVASITFSPIVVPMAASLGKPADRPCPQAGRISRGQRDCPNDATLWHSDG